MWVNLCIHDIVIVKSDTFKFVIAPSGVVARVDTETVSLGEDDGIPITETIFKDVIGLPAPQEGTKYIVSKIVAERCADRTDVYFPNENIRNDQKKVIGSASLTPSTVFKKNR